MLHRLRQSLLKELQHVLPSDGGNSIADDQAVRDCAIIRLYCALKDIASLRQVPNI